MTTALLGFALAATLVILAPGPDFMLVMRNTVRGRRIEHRGFGMVMIATIVAGSWSLMSGTVVVMALTACGICAG